MKKLKLSLLTLSLFSAVTAKDILSVDRDTLFAKSKAGKHFIQQQEKQKKEAEQSLREKESKIRSESQAIEKQAAMLTQDAFREKQVKLAREIRNLERAREDLQDELKMTFQAGVKKLQDDQYKAATLLFKNKGGKVLVDAKTPGVLAVSADTDITDEVLKVLDSNFEKSTLVQEKKA